MTGPTFPLALLRKHPGMVMLGLLGAGCQVFFGGCRVYGEELQFLPAAPDASSTVGSDASTSVDAEASTGDEAASTSGTGGSSTGLDETSSGTGNMGGSLVCTPDGEGDVFPEFDRVCLSDADCALVYHHTHCCGWPTRAIGLSAGAVAAFEAANAACQAMRTDCSDQCPPPPPNGVIADDGATGAWADVQVACMAAGCQSFFP